MSDTSANAVLREITQFFLGSRDFNGLPFRILIQKVELSSDEVARLLEPLVREDLVGVIHGDDFINPHIIRTGFAPKDHQLKKLDSDSLSNACIYPRRRHLEAIVDPSDYTGKPYTLRLALGEPHLAFRSFELSVLEHYRNDPRYYYQNDDVNGSLSVRDKHFESGSMRKHDEVILKFGFSYNDDLHRAVAAFLTELSRLSSEHQMIWQAKELSDEYKLHPDFYRNMVIGDWGEKVPIFHAFLVEIWMINQIAELMGRPPLFRKDFGRYIEDKPRNFGFLIRPTSKEYADFVHLLDKLLSENLNKKFFQGEVADQYDNGRRKGTINMLDEWTRRIFRPTDWEPWEKAIEAFKDVRKQRQKPAHAIIENEFNQDYIRKQRELMVRSYTAVRTLRMVLENHPSVTGDNFEVPETIQEGRIWTI